MNAPPCKRLTIWLTGKSCPKPGSRGESSAWRIAPQPGALLCQYNPAVPGELSHLSAYFDRLRKAIDTPVLDEAKPYFSLYPFADAFRSVFCRSSKCTAIPPPNAATRFFGPTLRSCSRPSSSFAIVQFWGLLPIFLGAAHPRGVRQRCIRWGSPAPLRSHPSSKRSTASQQAVIAPQPSSPQPARRLTSISYRPAASPRATLGTREPAAGIRVAEHTAVAVRRSACYGTCTNTLLALCKPPTASAALRVTNNAFRHPCRSRAAINAWREGDGAVVVTGVRRLGTRDGADFFAV